MKDNYFLSRKSCRQFKDIKLDMEAIKGIIKKASKAPTCGNMQLYSVIITMDDKRLKHLSEFHYNQPAAFSAPCILTVCADFNRFTRWCEKNKSDAGYDNFHSFLTAMTDAIIFTQQIVTVAEKEGFGTCYLGTVTYNAKEIADFLELPDLVVPVASISIGCPESPGEVTDRLSPEAVMHFEKYRKDSDEQIEDLFNVHTKNPANEIFIKQNGKENLAQVFAEIRYPRNVNEKNSQTYLSLLKEKKFL